MLRQITIPIASRLRYRSKTPLASFYPFAHLYRRLFDAHEIEISPARYLVESISVQ